MKGWRERTGGWKGGKGEEGLDKHARMHARMHAHMNTHTSSSSASEICGVGRISLLLFLASLALHREGHTFTLCHTSLQTQCVYVRMYVHTHCTVNMYVRNVRTSEDLHTRVCTPRSH